MSNTKTEIDFEKIIDEYCNAFLERKRVLLAMKEAVKAARDISLQEAAEEAEVHPKYINLVDKSSIINLANSEELNKKLGL